MWLASLALASPPYPEHLAELAQAPCTLSCTVCHATSAGGAGTVTTAFGRSLLDEGLSGGDLEGLERVWSSAATRDTDGDGLPDGEALAAGLDPSTGAKLCSEATPVYGCLSHVLGAPGWAAAALAFVAARTRPRRARQGQERTRSFR